jgi:D-methionine transport system ATP-binding protein
LSTTPSQFRLAQVGLKTALGAQSLLQDISCEICRGDRLVIVGPSGAGKTSLLRLLNRLSELSQGQIFFEAQEIRQIPVLQLRQQVMLVSQESKLLGMTVREALAYPLQLQGMARSSIQQRLSTWMEQLHIPEDWLERTEVQLSVGQRQWVAIARALITQPKVVLMDEPTSALDAGRSHHLLQVLQDLTETQQTTIVMVNHQLELAQQFSNRVLYLHQGNLELDRATEQVDWTQLKENLLKAEEQEAQAWA